MASDVKCALMRGQVPVAVCQGRGAGCRCVPSRPSDSERSKEAKAHQAPAVSARTKMPTQMITRLMPTARRVTSTTK